MFLWRHRQLIISYKLGIGLVHCAGKVHIPAGVVVEDDVPGPDVRVTVLLRRLLRHLGSGPELNTEIRHLSRDKLQIFTTPLGLAVSTSRSLIAASVSLITALVTIV